MIPPDCAISVADLLAFPKKVSRVFRASTRDIEHARLDLELAAECPGRFHVFVRVLRTLSENFSVGLRYFSAGAGETVLLRVNGDHGSHRNPDGAIILEGPHLHSFRPPLLNEAPRPSTHLRWASPLPPDHVALPAAWRTFCGQIAFIPDSKVDRIIGKLCASLAQLPLPGP
jgi:hypothetical protein